MKMWLSAVAVAGLCFCAAGASAAEQQYPKTETKAGEKDQKVAVADLPKAVADAANKAQPGGTINEAEQENKNGAAVYELEIVNNGKKYEVKIDATGKLLSNKVDDDADEQEDDCAKNGQKKK